MYYSIFRPFDPQYFNEEVRDEDDEESKARLKLQVRTDFLLIL